MLMFVFVLPCIVKQDFFFQYDTSGHMCTWNFNGHIDASGFDYIQVFYYLFLCIYLLSNVLCFSYSGLHICIVVCEYYDFILGNFWKFCWHRTRLAGHFYGFDSRHLSQDLQYFGWRSQSKSPVNLTRIICGIQKQEKSAKQNKIKLITTVDKL